LVDLVKYANGYGKRCLLNSIKNYPTYRMFYFEDFWKVCETYEVTGTLGDKEIMADFMIDNGLTTTMQTDSKDLTKILFSVDRGKLLEFLNNFFDLHCSPQVCDDLELHSKARKYDGFSANGNLVDEFEFVKLFKEALFEDVVRGLRDRLVFFKNDKGMIPERLIRETFYKMFPRVDKVMFEFLLRTISNYYFLTKF
jgi:hypothetical protein